MGTQLLIRSLLAVLLFAVGGSIFADAATAPLAWPEVTRTMKPWAINWWMGGAVNEAGLENQCAEMARARFGGFNVVHIYNDKYNLRHPNAPRKPYVPDEKCRAFLSPEWLDAWNSAVRIARSHGLGVDLSMCSGWCFGGPWVTQDDAASSLVRVHVPGPGGEGYHIDPFSATAMSNHIARFEAAFGRNGTAERPRGFYHDSFEYYGARPKHGEDLDAAALACFTVWTDWCRANGYETRNQAHGAPANWLDLYAIASIPETEMFGRGDKNRDILLSKFASSAAHVAGRRLVSAEACTWVDEHFREKPADVKLMLDQLFLSGVNHVFYHGWNYSPVDADWPGWSFFASLQMNPRNPLWREVTALNDYVIRCQSIFQTWTPDNDLLVRWNPDEYRNARPGNRGKFMTIHNGDVWFHPTPCGKRARELWNAGYQFDFVSDRQLEANPALRARLDVARAKPSPFSQQANGLLSTRWRKDGRVLHFVVNTNGTPRVLTGRFTAMDPLTGRIAACSRYVLHPLASVFVTDGAISVGAASAPVSRTPLAGLVWRVTPVAGGPELPSATNLTALVSWSAWDERFAGTMRYETTFDRADATASLDLDLGDVREAAHVWLNGMDLGAALLPPYRFRLPAGLLRTKGNALRVEVSSLGANRVRWICRTNQPWKYFADGNLYNYDYRAFDAHKWQVVPCGLLGPVALVQRETVEDVPQVKPRMLEASAWMWPTAEAERKAAVGTAYFRTAFEVPAGKCVRRARFVITADNAAEAWINGVAAGRTGSERESWRHARGYDVTVRTGRNVFAIRAVNEDTGGRPTPAGVLVALDIAYADGTRQTVRSGRDWRCACAAPADWRRDDFDDAAWPRPATALPYGGGPWGRKVWGD